MTKPSALSVLLIGALSNPLCSCSDESSGDTVDENVTSDGSAYLVSVLTFTPEATTGYVGVISAIDSSSEIDITSNAIEVPGGATSWATPDGAALISDNESRRLRKFEIEDGRLAETGTLSFANEASGNLYGGAITFSADGRAFLNFVGSDQRVLEIDTNSMSIVRTFDIPAINKDGWTINHGYDSVFADGRLYVAIGWYDFEQADQLDSAGLVTIDVDSGDVTVDESTGCHSFDRLVLADDGFIYGGTAYVVSWIYAAYGTGVNSCARRVRAGETAWDDSYAYDLDAAVDGKTPWAVGVSGTEGHMWLAAIRPDFDPTGLDYTTLYTSPDAYRWVRVNLADPTEPAVSSDRAVTGPDIMTSTVDGKTFIMEVGENNDKTTLLDATGDRLVEYARFNGYMTGFVRLHD